MSNKEQQVKNSFIYLLPIITGSLLPIITIPVFTRILTKEDYGVLALAMVYSIFVNGLANFGMTAAYDRNYFQYRENRLEAAQLLYSCLLFVILNFLCLASLTYIFKSALSNLIIGSSQHGNILFWAFCGQFFTGVNYYYLTYYKNSESASELVKYTIAISFINLAISLFLVAYLRIGVIGIVYAQFLSGIVIFTVLTYKFTTFLKIAFSKKIFVASFRISYPLTPRIFLGVINTQFDKYMIGLLASVGGVGIYSIGQKFSSGIFSFMTAIQNVFSPETYKRMFDLQDEGGESIGKYLTPFAYICVFLAVVVGLFSEELITIMTPAPFHGAIDILTVLAMYYGFLFFGKVNGNQLIFAKKTHISSLLTIVSLCLNVGLNIIFIIRWGAIGAAWATCLAGLISGGISLRIAQKYYAIGWEYKRLAVIYFMFYFSCLLIILMRNYSVAYEFRLIAKCIAIISYCYLGMNIKVITVENLVIIKKLLPIKKVFTSDHT
jgi:O-antigen/teichoic acid export membrane protein